MNDLSRRRALLLSLGGALGLALPTALVASEEAEAQNTETPAAGTETPAAGTETPAPGTAGMKRRKTRRKGRHARRKKRRTGQPAPPGEAAPAQPQ